jgi:hypothetical protein
LPSNQKFPILLVAVGGVLLIAAAAIILIPNLLMDQSVSDEVSVQEPYPQVERINLTQAKEAHDSNSAVFVDVRDPAYYQTSHIPGALSVPLSDIEMGFVDLDPHDWIILYCT